MVNDEGLFLLEVLIDQINLTRTPCFDEKYYKTCATFEFLSVDPLEICDDDSIEHVHSGGPFIKNLNHGKSCLFSLKDVDIRAGMIKFPIKVTVSKCLRYGCIPGRVFLGECFIDMTKAFIQAREKYLDDPTTVSYQTLKDSFHIKDTNNAVVGDIRMFLRISCFGKLIVTKFQGGQSSESIETAGQSNGSYSSFPKGSSVNAFGPCIYKGIHGLGNTCNLIFGADINPIAKDPFNSTSCERPDDLCYCSEPRPSIQQHMACRNDDKYCLHVPKGALQRLLRQDLSEEQKLNIRMMFDDGSVKLRPTENSIGTVPPAVCGELIITKSKNSSVQVSSSINKGLQVQSESVIPLFSKTTLLSSEGFSCCSVLSASKESKNRISFSDILQSEPPRYKEKIHLRPKSSLKSAISSAVKTIKNEHPITFGNRETAVYMTFYDSLGFQKSSKECGTQATAAVNKSLQIRCNDYKDSKPYSIYGSSYYNSDYSSTNTISTQDSTRRNSNNLRCPNIYFFGTKTKPSTSKTLNSKPVRPKKLCAGPCAKKQVVGYASVQATSKPCKTCCTPGFSAGTSTSKNVSIKEDCSAPTCAKSGEMAVTISHIRIAPKEPCPIHGKEPCKGPKCKLATSEDHAPVNISTVSNPRRGVFELVIRKLVGAPLAKNELMLEWTPPPTNPCGSPCGLPCVITGPCISKCKVVCKPVSCKSKYKRPCGRMPFPCYSPCRSSSPCRRCGTCCKKPCIGSPCMSCSKCSPCRKPCGIPCSIPCKSSPCLRPCPVGRKKHRRCRSQPKIKPHRKHISPCRNRSQVCPVVRCRSLPGPCCYIPACPPKKCCSLSPATKCCKSLLGCPSPC